VATTGPGVRRVVLLGASNLTLGLPTVLASARSRLGPGPLEVLVAAGHGRSYGRWSRVGFRGLPAIRDCGLWAAAGGATGAVTHALVTDIGNDLAYGASAAELAGWVGACVERLEAMGAQIVLTLLPSGTLARLAPWRYHLFKAVLFPGRRLPLRVLRERVADVNERLAALGPRVRLVEPEAAWYGPDTIHIRRSRRAAAWTTVLSPWNAAPDCAAPGGGAPRVSLPGLAPELRTILGITRRRAQPSRALADGTTISLF